MYFKGYNVNSELSELQKILYNKAKNKLFDNALYYVLPTYIFYPAMLIKEIYTSS